MTDHGEALRPGTRIREFEIERELGSGGFGITYLARDLSLGRPVAVKEYLPLEWGMRRADGTVGPRSTTSSADYTWGLKRFMEEARVLARLDHRGIVKVYQVVPDAGTAYMVMEHVKGRTLEAELRESGPMPEARLLPLLRGIAEGLEVVHAADMLHRDVKPGNVMLREADGSPVLIDFGAARQDMGRQSRSLMQMLTPGYAPLEQHDSKGGRQGPWTDVYALGAVAYEALTGRVPDDAPGRVIADELPPVDAVAAHPLSRELAGAVMAALAVLPRDRPQTVGEWLKLEEDGSHEDERGPRSMRRPDGRANAKIGDGGGIACRRNKGSVPSATRSAWWRWAVGLGGLGAAAWVVVLWAGSAERRPGRTFRDCPACPEMVVIGPGTFRMGSPESEEGRHDSEGPQRYVNIPGAFALGVHEITFDEWNACARGGGCGGRVPNDVGWGEGRRPVINVSWEDTEAYMDWLSEETGEAYRLPSEAEWEYAARAGTETARYWGQDNSVQCAHANGADAAHEQGFPDLDYRTRVSCNDGYGATAPVGSYSPNAWGLHDMLGNVSEWTEDCWHDNYEGAPTGGGAWSGGHCFRVARGGSWDGETSDLRSAARDQPGLVQILRIGLCGLECDNIDTELYRVGFRVARTIN